MRYALIDSEDNVVNIILWDGVKKIKLPSGLTAVKDDEEKQVIGEKLKQ